MTDNPTMTELATAARRRYTDDLRKAEAEKATLLAQLERVDQTIATLSEQIADTTSYLEPAP